MQASRGGVWLGAVWLGNAGMARHDWAWRVPAWWGVVMQATHNKRISMSSKYNRVKAELDKLAVDGKLTAQAVVDAAREESSPLHGYFEWDDNKAANICFIFSTDSRFSFARPFFSPTRHSSLPFAQ